MISLVTNWCIVNQRRVMMSSVPTQTNAPCIDTDE